MLPSSRRVIATLIAILSISVFYYISYYVVKPLSYSSYIEMINKFYSNLSVEQLDEVHPLHEYNISLEELDYFICEDIVDQLNPPYFEYLSNKAKTLAVYDICGQELYNILWSAILSDDNIYKKVIKNGKVNTSLVHYCLEDYIYNHPDAFINLDNTPLKICLIKN